jgi:hypothetical protein
MLLEDKKPAYYLPQGHRIEKEAKGDLNKDGAHAYTCNTNKEIRFCHYVKGM